MPRAGRAIGPIGKRRAKQAKVLMDRSSAVEAGALLARAVASLYTIIPLCLSLSLSFLLKRGPQAKREVLTARGPHPSSLDCCEDLSLSLALLAAVASLRYPFPPPFFVCARHHLAVWRVFPDRETVGVSRSGHIMGYVESCCCCLYVCDTHPMRGHGSVPPCSLPGLATDMCSCPICCTILPSLFERQETQTEY